MTDNTDKINRLLQNPFYLHSALLKVMPKTHDKETYELQRALLQVNYANLLLRKQIFELEQT
jgi:hypothetical protein